MLQKENKMEYTHFTDELMQHAQNERRSPLSGGNIGGRIPEAWKIKKIDS